MAEPRDAPGRSRACRCSAPRPLRDRPRHQLVVKSVHGAGMLRGAHPACPKSVGFMRPRRCPYLSTSSSPPIEAQPCPVFKHRDPSFSPRSAGMGSAGVEVERGETTVPPPSATNADRPARVAGAGDRPLSIGLLITSPSKRFHEAVVDERAAWLRAKRRRDRRASRRTTRTRLGIPRCFSTKPGWNELRESPRPGPSRA